MGFRDVVAKALGYRLGKPAAGGLQFYEMQLPPNWSYQSYLKAYGEIGWLYAAVNVIAEAVARTGWHLYEIDKDGNREEIFRHDLIDLLNRMNPFQTRYQFFYLGTMYKLLVGEEFWQLNFDGRRQPAEIWLAPPAYMSVIPSSDKYIDHYEYLRTGMAAPVKFTIEEIIHIKTPNPYNEYRGLSPAQALTVDLDSERYAARYQQKLFFNEAVPGFMLKYPAENLPPKETRTELMQEWDERFKGFRNRGRTAFLWGAEPATITMTNRDMDFERLRKFNRDAILGAYHIPRSVIGITEDVNRANAEAGHYIFAMYTVQPELAAIREALNKELCPLFGDNLYLDFENPVPEDTIQEANNVVNLFKAGIITRNEARQATEYEALEGPEGEVFFSPQPSLFGAPAVSAKPEDNIPKRYKAIFADEPAREEYWKTYTKRVETYETPIIKNLKAIFDKQKAEAHENLKRATGPNTALINQSKFREAYDKAVYSTLESLILDSVKHGMALVPPKNPHKQIPPVISQAAIAWLKSRITWAANEIGDNAEEKLNAILVNGYKEGMSIDQIAKEVDAFFDDPMRSERIARTETIMASAQGTLEGYKETGVVSKAEFYTALDERTCEYCNGLHGELYTLDDAAPMIPLHPLCRCVWLPVIEE